MPSIKDDINFQDRILDVSLSGFETFDFENVSSWSQIELYAAVVGKDIDMEFVKSLLVISYYFPALFDVLVEAIRLCKGSIDDFANTVKFVEWVFKIWNKNPIWPGYAEMHDQIEKIGVQVSYRDWNSDRKEKDKYRMLSALDGRFPYLLVKFYGVYAKDLYERDSQFVYWLLRKINEKCQAGDARLVPILSVMEKDMVTMSRTNMFMS